MSEAALFVAQRPRLWSLAYRMLGSASDAEDIVQEAWIRWQTARPDDVESPGAWLTTVVARLSLDRLKRAKTERKNYPGTWLPEPIPTSVSEDEADRVSLAFLLVLEQLNPVERAVYLLREAFDHGYAEIAAIVEKSEVACRQVHHRACARLEEARPKRFSATRAQHERLVRAFLEAVREGDLTRLEALLAEDARLSGDGGGKAPALREPLRGAGKIAQFFLRLAQAPGFAETDIAVEELNGWPAIVVRRGARTEAAITLETDGERVVEIRNVLNPDKLARA